MQRGKPFWMIYQNTLTGIAITDWHGQFLECNPAFCALVGYTEEELRSREFLSLVHPEDREATMAQNRRLQQGAIPSFEIENRYVHKNGQLAWVRKFASLLPGEQDGPARIMALVTDITERRRSQEALRQSEERYRALAEQVEDGIFIAESNGQFTGANRAGCAMLGYTLEELKTLRIADVVVEEEHPRLQEQHERLAAGEAVCSDRRFRRKDGSVFYGEVVGRRLPDGRMQGVVRDISRRKEAEEKLRETQERQAFLLNLSDALHPLLDPVAIQGEAARMLGERLRVNRTLYAECAGGQGIVHRDYVNGIPSMAGRYPLAVFGQEFLRIYKRGEPFVVNDVAADARLDDSDRSVFAEAYVAAFIGVGLIKNGEFVATFGVHSAKPRDWKPDEVELVRAVAERTWDAVERAQAEAALRDTEERLRFILESSGTGAWDLDLVDHSAFRSLEHDRIFGYNELLPRWTYEMFLGHVVPEDREAVEARFRQAKETGGDWNFECRIRRIDGEVRWIWATGRIRPHPGGAPSRMAGIVQDITERKRAEEERALEVKRKDEFLTLLGHELRNPLAAISSAMHMLSGGVTAGQRDSLNDLMRRQLHLMRRLVDDLLDLGRIAQGRLELKMERVNLGDFLQKVTVAAQAEAVERGRELVLRLPTEPVVFMGDRARLEQIVANLLSNAFKYTARRGKIELSGAREADEVVLRCKDNGLGIPLALREKVFEPFARGETSVGYGEASLGIGLALVRELTERHGGKVSLESGGPGMGSEFIVRLPLIEPPAAQPPAAPTRPGQPLRNAMLIVVVEDNPSVAGVMQLVLEQAGHTVHLFPDGASALASLSAGKPDAVLLDIGLPGMDGYELLARMRGLPNLRQTQFFAISGFKQRARTGNAGGDFDHYFVKPVDVSEILALLAKRPHRAPEDAEVYPG